MRIPSRFFGLSSSREQLLPLSTTDRYPPFSKLPTNSLCFDLVRFLTEGVPQFVRDRKIEKLIKGDVPLLKQFGQSVMLGHKQRLLKKRLAPFQLAERWTTWVQMKASKG